VQAPQRPPGPYAPLVRVLEAAADLGAAAWLPDAAAVLLEEVLAESWETATDRDAAQVLVFRLERLAAARRGLPVART
jgi:hypothetical protein